MTLHFGTPDRNGPFAIAPAVAPADHSGEQPPVKRLLCLNFIACIFHGRAANGRRRMKDKSQLQRCCCPIGKLSVNIRGEVPHGTRLNERWLLRHAQLFAQRAQCSRNRINDDGVLVTILG